MFGGLGIKNEEMNGKNNGYCHTDFEVNNMMKGADGINLITGEVQAEDQKTKFTCFECEVYKVVI